jgi:ABC-type phosphate transport system substrate-binding protein
MYNYKLIKISLLIISLASLVIPLTAGCAAKTDDYSIHVYTRSDACGAAETWANYLDKHKQEDLKGTAVYGDPGLSEAVQKDYLGIGFNNIGYAYDTRTGEQLSRIFVIPIDSNENGMIDADENFCENRGSLLKAIAEGRYPSPPARDLHLATKDRFTGIIREFIRWILQDGQQYVEETGYIPLPEEKIAAELKKLGEAATAVKMEGIVSISGAFALYPMIVRWGEEFQKKYPNVRFDISAGGAGKGMTDALNKMVDIGMISRDINPAEIDKGAFWISVTRDAVVPVANKNNPFIKALLSKGLMKQAFTNVWITETVTDWRAITK